MPSVGSSSTSTAGRERPGDGELLLAAGQVAAAPVQHLAQHREQFVQMRRDRVPAGRVARPTRSFSSTVRRAKISRPLRHEADAGTRALAGRALLDCAAVELDGGPLTGTRPMSDLSSVVVPTPLRPRTTVTSPFFASRLTSRRM